MPGLTPKLTLALALACLCQTGVIVWVLVAERGTPTPSPAARDVSLDADLRQTLTALAERQERLERQLDELGRSAATPVRQPVVPEQGGPSPALDAAIATLDELTDRCLTIVKALPPSSDANAEKLAATARRYPEPNLANLTACCTAFEREGEERASREWLFRSAREVLETFGRPTDANEAWWLYQFTTSDGATGDVEFQISNGLVIRCYARLN